jgi:hypothetical protein
MDGKDERTRTPDRRIEARAKIDLQTKGIQYACKEYRFKWM